MAEYVLSHAGEERERERLELLERFHGPLTAAQLEGVVRPGWRCLEAGAGGGGMTSWLAERVTPGGSVLAVDLETHWLERLRSETVEVRTLDITTEELPHNAFDLVLARMLLLHLRDPPAACRRLLASARKGATIIVHDADFAPVALADASAAEVEGLRTMTDTMTSAGVDLSLGPKLARLIESVGAEVVEVTSSPSPACGGELAAQIVAITIERFRERAESNGTRSTAIDAALGALHDPSRGFTGPTQWIVRARCR
jgi:SAM-dependent methyltransferase